MLLFDLSFLVTGGYVRLLHRILCNIYIILFSDVNANVENIDMVFLLTPI